MKTIKIGAIADQQIINRAVDVLRSGGLFVYPTETVYGLGVDATNQQAVNKLLKFKGQRGHKPILIAASDQQMAERYVELNDIARGLYKTFLPGPVAVVSRGKAEGLARGITSVDGTVGIRIPSYPIVLKIIAAFGKPITSTSANVSGARNPWSITDVLETTSKNKLELIDLMLDAGQLPKRPPSTIVDTSREETEIVREGGIALEALLNYDSRFTIHEEYASHSKEETKNTAQQLTSSIIHKSKFLHHESTMIIALSGRLGAGKTVFAKGIARALGITDVIRSPSYTLVREYRIPSSFSPLRPSSFLFHIDAWRLSDPSEFQDLGLGGMLKPGNVIVIEWIERLNQVISDLQKKATIVLVQIDVASKDEREIKITM